MPPLPATAAQALLTSLGNQAKFFFSADNRPPFDTAGFIATDDPAPIAFRPAKQLARAACRAWARQEGPSTNPAADRLYSDACGEYLDSIGEGVEPGDIGPPFEGGQCEGVTYNVSFTGTIENPPTTQNFEANIVGPLRWNQDLPTNPPGSENCSDGLRFNKFSLAGSGGSTITWQGCGAKLTVNSVNPLGVGANNCGSPPPEYERPRPPIVLPPITPIFIDLPDIGEITVNVNVDAEGLITIESPTLDVEVNIGGPNDGTDDGDDGGGGLGPEDIAPDGGTPADPADTGDGGTAAGCAPSGFELVGVRVEVLERPVGFNQYANNPSEVIRGIGYVRMGYPNRLALDMGGSAVISPQFFLAPVRGLTCWEVRANNGFINRCTPFYRELPS